MKKSLAQINKEYENILHSNSSENVKTKRFSELMTYMEKAYNIPGLRNEAWEKENKAVISLYRKISMSRDI